MRMIFLLQIISRARGVYEMHGSLAIISYAASVDTCLVKNDHKIFNFLAVFFFFFITPFSASCVAKTIFCGGYCLTWYDR